jgi:RNA polymerase sigma-70 factor (ECF subfamily)
MSINIDTIWKEYRMKLFRFIRNRVDDYSIAEDITQDVFVKIIKNIDSLQSDNKLQSWLYQIARNSIIDYYRLKKPFLELPELPQSMDDSNKNVIEDFSECIMPMIKKLPKLYKDALILYEFDGKTHKDIALAQGISISASKSRVQRGRAILRKLLTDCCYIEYDRSGRVCDFEQKSKNCSDC